MNLSEARKILRSCYESGNLKAHTLYDDSDDPWDLSARIKLANGKCAGFTALQIKNALIVMSENTITTENIHTFSTDLSTKLNIYLQNSLEEIGIILKHKPVQAAVARLGFYFRKDKAEITQDGHILLKDLSADELKAFITTFKDLQVDKEFINVDENLGMSVKVTGELIKNICRGIGPQTTAEVRSWVKFRDALAESGVFLTLTSNYNYRRTGFDKDVTLYRHLGRAAEWHSKKDIYLKDGILTVDWTPSIHEKTHELQVQKLREIKETLSYLTGSDQEPEVYTVKGKMYLPSLETSVGTFDYKISVPFTDKARTTLAGFISVSQLEENAPSPETGIYDIEIEKWKGETVGKPVARGAA